jgi:DNA recombination protein RmuC
LSEQANNLTAALKTDTRKQGNWGEFLLERILEVSGLESGVHYKKQLSVGDGEGTTRRPDVVILLPENRHVVVDAKVSLTAYERYFASTDEAEQQRALKDHLRSVRSHIDELSRKSYERLFDGSPDFVLMFIPVEPAYGLAIMQDNNLFSDAFRKKVILVSVSSLLATLRIIDALWRLEKQNRNAAEIIRQGGQLYDKFVGFVEDMQSLGVKLKGAQYEFGQAFGKLTEGRGNLVRKAEQMKSLGLDTRKRLPDTLTENALDPGAD